MIFYERITSGRRVGGQSPVARCQNGGPSGPFYVLSANRKRCGVDEVPNSADNKVLVAYSVVRVRLPAQFNRGVPWPCVEFVYCCVGAKDNILAEFMGRTLCPS